MKKTILLSCIFVLSLLFQAFLSQEVRADVVVLEATYSVDVSNGGIKYYHDGNDWVGRANSGPIRAVNRWNIASIDPSWDILSVEVRFYTESKTGSPGTLSITRYGTSHGEDNPESDTGTMAYTKINNTPYASLPEPSSGSWTNWVNLGSIAASDITWCRDGGLSTWSLGLKASDAIETSTTIRHADFSEDNEANDAELRITYTQSSSSNTPPTATIDSITPNPATVGQSVTFTGHGVDTDGTVTAYEWTSSITGILSTASTFSTSSLSAGTHTISLRVRDDDGAWSTPVTTGLTVSGGSTTQLTLEASYSTDINSSGTKYYHDGNDWVGRANSGPIRAVNRWNIASIDPSWDILSVEVRFYTESKTGSPGTLSITRYGTSHGEDNPESDTGTMAYTKINNTPYASLPEPSSGSWTNWVNLGSIAASDITWCRDGGLSTWSLGLKASDAIETSTTIRHADFSEDNEANDAELRITYTQSSSSNTPPTATIDSITPNPATVGQSVTFTGHGVDTDGTVTAYEWTSSITGILSTASTFSTSSLSAGTHTISLRVRDDDGAWSTPVTTGLTVSGGSTTQLTLEASYSTDINSSGTKYYHDGNDWVGRANSGPIRAVNRWNIASIDPSWDILSVEVRFYTESKTGSPGTLSITRYGTSHGEDNPESDTGTMAYTKINNTPYASLPEPSSGSWTNWVNLGSIAASDITWCRDGGLSTWSLGLKASDAIETSTTIRHADFSEDNEANDAELRITYTSSSSVTLPFSDDFNRSTLGNDWSLYDDDNNADKVPNWQIISGELHQVNRVESTSSFDGTYHRGAYAYLTSKSALTDYRFTVEATYLNDEYGKAEDIGVMFRYQNNDNYYRLTLNSRYGFTRLEKKVNGTFSTLAKNARGFQKGAKLGIKVDVKGSIIQVFLDNDPLFGVSDTSISHGSIALYCQDAAKFDNVVLEESSSQPSIVLTKPTAHSLEIGSTLNVEAVTTNVPSGGYVEYLLDGTSSIVITQPPYSAQYYNVSEGTHSVKAVLHGSSSELAVDVNDGVQVFGDYYIAIGDSITNGAGDSYTSDNILQDGTIISFQGYEAPLTYNLNLSTSYPNLVFNEGIGGDKSYNAAYVRINSILERHPGANIALIMLGTNDSSGTLPVASGLGCFGTSCSGTFKGNMQALVNTLISRQITPFVARIPPTFVPSPEFRNSWIQEYNQVIQWELTGIQVGPDFYSFFTNSSDLFFDELHPNSLGHKTFAQLWYNVLRNQNVVPFVLDNLSPATYKQNLLEVGNNYYIDANYAISSIPSALTEGDVVWIMTADSDRNNTSTNSLSFQINANSTVYIGYDPRALSLPSWLANNFTPAGTVIGVTDPDVSTLNLYQADFAAGTVSLGGNKASGASFPAGVEAANYVVIVKKGVN